ncbi:MULTISPECIES: hypothetical protein [Paenibacillus]|nr:hypothetical protein [Paenibacillus borealis]
MMKMDITKEGFRLVIWVWYVTFTWLIEEFFQKTNIFGNIPISVLTAILDRYRKNHRFCWMLLGILHSIIVILEGAVEMNGGLRVNSEGYFEDVYRLQYPVVDEEIEFDQKVRVIVSRIVAKRAFPNVSDTYADIKMKQRNLLHYFIILFWQRPGHMFIGEAQGKYGCLRTGIPFTSERLIRRKRFKKHLPHARFVVEGNQAERSATMI